jgi:ATP-dependent Clp protease ATP-binding subunit ClpB
MEIDSMPASSTRCAGASCSSRSSARRCARRPTRRRRSGWPKLEKELADLKEERRRLQAQWQQEKDEISGSSKLKEQLEQARLELERAQRGGDYTKASELQYGRIPELEKRLAQQESARGAQKGRAC